MVKYMQGSGVCGFPAAKLREVHKPELSLGSIRVAVRECLRHDILHVLRCDIGEEGTDERR